VSADPAAGHVDLFDAAVEDIRRLTLALRTAIEALDYAQGARTRGEVVAALSRTQTLADSADAAGTHTVMLQEFRDIRAIASVILEIAPAPSAAAVEAATRGNETLWAAEEHAWIVGRLVGRLANEADIGPVADPGRMRDPLPDETRR
jgi:hypothetical protein